LKLLSEINFISIKYFSKSFYCTRNHLNIYCTFNQTSIFTSWLESMVKGLVLLLHCYIKYWPSNKIFLFYLNSKHKIIVIKLQLIDCVIIFLYWYYFKLLFFRVWYKICYENKCHHCKYTNRCTTPKDWLIIWLTIDTQKNQLSKYI
jgi:hypothetical protein